MCTSSFPGSLLVAWKLLQADNICESESASSMRSSCLFLSCLDYAEPAVAAVGHKVGSTFRPSSYEDYTTPFTFNHYDTPGNLPEYAEPLPPEPEYATPFSEQAAESHGLLVPAPTSGIMTTSSHARYDCPSHRMLSNGYCTPAIHASGPRPVSMVYAEPKPCDSLLQKNTYEEPL